MKSTLLLLLFFVISTVSCASNQRCGSGYGKCPAGECCSKWGYCGTTSEYCSNSQGCQLAYGDCKCGSGFGNCAAGSCCSKWGFCGKTSDYCSNSQGCQLAYGDCKCGSGFGKCAAGSCCSKYGYCGKTAAYCSNSQGCQLAYGDCRCGSEFGSCASGNCCSQWGYCGKTSDYCSTQPPQPPQQDGEIRLTTTYYNQCDNRNDTYNGCSLCGSGCLVTALTMMYNQSMGTNYYPTTYASQKMSFNGCAAAGGGYGPGVKSDKGKSNQGLQQKDALDNIMNSLKNGHIAVVGGDGYRNGYSTSHFVAVYGYVGNYQKPYKTSDFLMYDPGDRYKSTLDQLFAYITYNYQTLTF